MAGPPASLFPTQENTLAISKSTGTTAMTLLEVKAGIPGHLVGKSATILANFRARTIVSAFTGGRPARWLNITSVRGVRWQMGRLREALAATGTTTAPMSISR